MCPISTRETATPVLVLGSGERAAAVIIDGLPERKRFVPESAVGAEVAPSALSHYSLGSYRDASGVWTEFDSALFFDDFARRTA